MTVTAEFPNKVSDSNRHEQAARELCRLRGVDPDDFAHIDREYEALWVFAEREIIDAERIRAALAYADRVTQAENFAALMGRTSGDVTMHIQAEPE